MFGGGGGMGGLFDMSSMFGGGGGLGSMFGGGGGLGSMFSMFGKGFSNGAKIPKGFYVYETELESNKTIQSKGGKRYYMVMGRVVKAYISQETLDAGKGLSILYVSRAGSDSQAKLANEGQGAVVVVGDVNIQEKVDSRFIDLVNQKIGSEYKVDRILFFTQK